MKLRLHAALAGTAVTIATSASVATAATTPLPAATAACMTPTFSQPFASIGDQNLYSLMPGETPGSFNGAGWTSQTARGS